MTSLLPRDRRYSRFLFDWSAADAIERGTLNARTGQAATFSRTGNARHLGSNGVLGTAIHSQPRYEWRNGEPFLLLEDTRTNICLYSEQMTTAWSTNGSLSGTADAHSASGVSLWLFSGTSGIDTIQQDFSFTGDGVKAVSFFVKQGPITSSSGSAFSVTDVTGGGSRINGSVNWVNGVPGVSMSAGTFLGSVPMADGVYRLLFASTTVTASHTHRITIQPMFGTGSGGSLYTAGVQFENATMPSSYIKTTSAAVARPAEELTYPFLVPPRAMTMYVRLLDVGTHVNNGISNGVIGVGSSNAQVFLDDESGAGFAIYHVRSTNANAIVSGLSVPGDTVELCGVLRADGSVYCAQSINGGTQTVSVTSSANALATAWVESFLRIGARAGVIGLTGFSSVRLALGEQTMATMRGG